MIRFLITTLLLLLLAIVAIPAAGIITAEIQALKDGYTTAKEEQQQQAIETRQSQEHGNIRVIPLPRSRQN